MLKTIKENYIHLSFLFIFVLLAFVLSQHWGNIKISGPSMEPTYHDGDRLIVKKKTNYKNNDIIVFKIYDSTQKKGYKILIKRIVGSYNDSIEFKENNLYRNEKKIHENYIKEGSYHENKLYADKIAYKHYFVLGDNRNNSLDSRDFGVIDEKQIIGKVSYVYWKDNKLFP